MYKKRNVEVRASEIAEILNSKFIGNDFIVRRPSSLENIKESSVVYVNVLSAEALGLLKGTKNVLVITGEEIAAKPEGFAYIVVANPKLAFAQMLNEFFVERSYRMREPTAVISPDAKIGRNVSIGAHAVIGPDVVIGDNSIILNNAVITGDVSIGSNCVIKDNATIGSEGYSFEFDEAGVPVHMPYVGRILIGDNVWVGANSTVERGQLDDTRIEDFVKIDDLVQIGKECVIGQKTMIAAGTIISANAVIGKECWLAPNVTIRDAIRVADNAFIGLGAVVIEDIAKSGVYVGNPARFLRPRKE